jgi:hypothetical protein
MVKQEAFYKETSELSSHEVADHHAAALRLETAADIEPTLHWRTWYDA